MAQYPYLVTSLALMAVALLAMLIWPRHRLGIFISGLLCAPTGLLTLVFVPAYWQPVRVTESILGAEDVLFSFANGATVWAMVAVAWSGRLGLAFRPRPFARRYGALCAVGAAAFFPLLLVTSLGIMTIGLMTMATLAAAVLWRRARLWPVAMFGATSFVVWYVIWLKLSFVIWPDFAEQWSHESLWGLQWAGMPLEEIAWAIAFGAAWPTMIAYLLSSHRPGQARLATPANFATDKASD